MLDYVHVINFFIIMIIIIVICTIIWMLYTVFQKKKHPLILLAIS